MAPRAHDGPQSPPKPLTYAREDGRDLATFEDGVVIELRHPEMDKFGRLMVEVIARMGEDKKHHAKINLLDQHACFDYHQVAAKYDGRIDWHGCLLALIEPVQETLRGTFGTFGAASPKGLNSLNSLNSHLSDGDEDPLTPWPIMDPAAYYGLAGDIVRTIGPHTEADDAALLIQMLIAVGNVVGRQPHCLAEADYHGLNEFAVLVGATSKGRKGSSAGHIRRLLSRVDPEWVGTRLQAGLSSGEGLIWAVRDPIIKREVIRQKGRPTGEYEDVIADAGVEDKRLLVLEAELSSTLRVIAREGNTLSAIIRQAWDDGTLRVLTKNNPATATGAHISIVGHITRDELLRYLDNTEAGNGFGNRFLWCCVRRSKALPEGGNLQEGELTTLVMRLKRAIDAARTVQLIVRDEDARAIWREIYAELSEGSSGLLGAMTSRAEAHVMRLSAIYALMNASAVVRADHLLAALAVWQYCEESAKFIFGASLGDPLADELLRVLRATKDGMTKTEISHHFGRHKSASQISRALNVLHQQGLAHCEKQETEGRAAEVWRATGHAKKAN